MIFRQHLGEQSQASYFLGCPSREVAAVVDPARDIRPYIQDAEAFGLRIIYVIDTHIHADHLSGARKLAQHAHATIVGYETAPSLFSVSRVKNGDLLNIGNLVLEVFHTPGHTPEHMTLIARDLSRNTEKPWFVLSGHSLMVGDVGRPDLAPQLSARAMYETIFHRFSRLADDTEIWPAAYSGSVCGRKLSGKRRKGQ